MRIVPDTTAGIVRAIGLYTDNLPEERSVIKLSQQVLVKDKTVGRTLGNSGSPGGPEASRKVL